LSEGRNDASLDVTPPSGDLGRLRIALVGNPNTGKTTLFNRLTGLRHHTSNFAGTTVEARIGSCRTAGAGTRAIELVDLPGLYSLELAGIESEIVRNVLAGTITTRGDVLAAPDAVVVVLDATNLQRNMPVLGEVLRRRLPTIIAINMIDLAAKERLVIDGPGLSRALGCAVVHIAARSGLGCSELRRAMSDAASAGVVPTITPPGDEAGLRLWADGLVARYVRRAPSVLPKSGAEANALAAAGNFTDLPAGSKPSGKLGPLADALAPSTTDRIDAVLTHPITGPLAFLVIMAGLFYTIFSVAHLPMDMLSILFTYVSAWVSGLVPAGLVHDLITQGVIPGVGATLIFLPQICLLFLLISILEDTGYLARAAFVADRVLRPFGLPGHAFVPLLSSHACALPGIISARTIPDPRERLATILVAPFMTCSARLPVYVLLIGILFPDSPWQAALAFIGCYALGLGAGMLSAIIARRTLLRGTGRPMAIELPSYKLPSLRTSLLTTYDRAVMFVKKAGTVILAISIILWWLGAFPRVGPPASAVTLQEQAAAIVATDDASKAAVAELESQAERLTAINAKRESFIGTMGQAVAPVFKPLGLDWQLTVGVLASFAAREVFVGTMSIVIVGQEDDDGDTIRQQLANARRDDGQTLLFTRPTAWALLVFYVLAMQCLPTLVVTAREAGGARWAMLQLGWMSLVAFVAAAATFWLAGG